MTLDELTETYAAMIERDNRDKRFHAQIAGADLADGEQEKSGGLKEYMQQREQEIRESKAVAGQVADFGSGIGHKVIGG